VDGKVSNICNTLRGLVEEQAVQASHSNNIFPGMVNSSQNFSGVVVVGSQDFCAFLWDNLRNSLFVEIKFELGVGIFLDINDMEIIVKHSCHDLVGVRTRADAEFIKNAFILIEFTELCLDRVINRNIGKRLTGISEIPNFDCTKISGKNIFSIRAETCITN